jgi:hypothetical protein
MYPTLVTLSLILVFGSSAFMSISGLLSIFSNNTITIISMGLGMEIGKILSISHLYRTWQKNNNFTKVWYIFIILVLTLLTSFEVMGFLSQCHQKSVQDIQIIQSKVEALNDEESVLRSQIHIIDQTLNGLPETHVSRRINERKNSGYSEKQNRLLELIRQKANLETQLISGDDNSNPILAIAKILKMDDSFIISIFIPFLVLILEPLSIGLTIAANSAWINYQKPEPPKNAQPKNQIQTKELNNLQKDYDLSVFQIAKITGRKKLKTCEGWLKGTIPTPQRALAEVQAWVETEYVKEREG